MPDCEFFEPWSHQPCSPPVVARFLATIGPLAEVDLRCVPSEWLLLGIILHCGGQIQLSEPDLALIAEVVSARMPNANELCRGAFADFIPPESMECLVMNTLPPGSSDEDWGRTWAWWLVTAFGAKTDIFLVDPGVVAAIQSLMGGWPVSSDAWWSYLWSGLPGGPTTESVNVRVAIFEALHGMLPEDEWLYRMADLAELERDQNEVAGVALLSMGACLGRYMDGDMLVSGLAVSGGDRWRRALVMGFPDELKWPATEHGAASSAVIQALVEMRDSADYPYRMDIVQNQWQLLGPVEASLDMERFVYGVDPSMPNWDWEAAIRVSAAVDAIQSSSSQEGDAEALAYARELVKELFLTSSESDSRSILVALRDRWWVGASVDDKKKMLADILGPELLVGLDPGLRSWLERP